jgi:hypothetical protein
MQHCNVVVGLGKSRRRDRSDSGGIRAEASQPTGPIKPG